MLLLLQATTLLKQSNYPTFTPEGFVHMGELIWNKYRRPAIPEYLFNFPSGKKELKDRPAISPSSPFPNIF